MKLYTFVRFALLTLMVAVCSGRAAQINLQAFNGQWVCAEGGGGQAVVANRGAASGWETFTLNDSNGGLLESGDEITIQAPNGQYFCAEGGGGQAVVANRDGVGGWEVFRIYKMNGGGSINSGDQVAIQVWNGQYICAEGGGGGEVVANRDGVGGWETFSIVAAGGSTPDPTPSASISPNTTTVVTGQTVYFTISGSCEAGLNEIGLELCDSAGNPVANMGAVGVGGASASYTFSWTANSPGTYLFDGYAWNFNRSALARTGVIVIGVGSGVSTEPHAAISPSATSISAGQAVNFTVTGNCEAGLNEIGLELCDSNGAPVANLGLIGVGGTSASNIFSWTGTSPGTFVFDGYAWNFDRSALARTGPITVTVAAVNLPPTADSITNSGSPTSSTSFEAYANNVLNATRVQFPTWTEANGQDDIVWYEGNYDSANNRWKVTVNKSSHNSENGHYNIHVYATGANGGSAFLGATSVTLTPPAPPAADSITNSGSPTSNASFEVYANNVRNATLVLFPTWTDAGSQDDIVWHEGTYDSANNRWKVVVHKGSHNNETGGYTIHVYALGTDGQTSFLGGTGVTLIGSPATSAGYNLVYEYNNRSQVAAIKNADGTAVAAFGYGVDGRRNSRSLGNATQTEYGYDGAGRMNYLRNYRANDNSTLQTQEYGYDLRDRRIWTQRDGNLGDTYAYQADSQLIDYKKNASDPRGTPSGWAQQVSYGYDPVGNRTGVTDNGMVTSYGVDHANQYSSITDTTIQYGDARGNVTQWKEWSYTFDAENRMLSASKPGVTIAFAYDPNGRLAKRTINGQPEFRFYDGVQQILRHDGSGTEVEKIVWGPSPDEILTDFTAAQGGHYYHADIQGNTVAVTDANRNVLEYYRYDPYGNTTFSDANGVSRADSACSVRFLFNGQERFSATDGLYNYKNRFYSPGLGRFVQADPARLGAGDLNLYRYCGNDPVDRTDPLGLIWDDASGWWGPRQYGIFLQGMFVDPAVEGFQAGSKHMEAGFGEIANANSGLDRVIGGAHVVAAVGQAVGVVLNLTPAGKAENAAVRAGEKLAIKTEAAVVKVEGKVNTAVQKVELHRPYIRKDVRAKVESRAPRTPDGRAIDPNTMRPIERKPDLGHKPGHEFRTEKAKAEAEGLSQKEFNDRMNNPDLYQLEDPSSNRSHRFEQK